MRIARIVHVIRQIGSLAVTTVTAATTLNAYRPFARGGYPSLFSWMFGLVVTELPLQTLLTQLGGLALTGRRLTRPVRITAWIVAGLSALGLLNLSRAGHRANVPLTEALDSGLGADRLTESESLWRQPSGAGTAKTPGLLRMLRIYRDYAHDSDISYGEYGSANHLDIWRRPDLDQAGKAPVLFQIPGGAWMTGNKRGQAHPLMSHLAELGWVCVAANYRHSPRNTWPDHIVDVKRALAWVKEHIAEYGGDPDFVVITGGSAGGHLTALAALTQNDPQFQPGFEDADTRVQAAVPLYGIYDFTRFDKTLHPMMPALLIKSIIKQKPSTHLQTFEAASPITHVRADAPPFFVLHGSNDSLAYVEQARTFVEQLRQVSEQPVVYAELPLTQHAFDIFGSVRAAHAAVAVEQFLAEIYAAHLRADAVAAPEVS